MMKSVVLTKQSLSGTLLSLIETEKVHLLEKDGIIRISPLREGSGLLGFGVGCNLTTEKFLSFKAEEKKKESEQLGQ